MSSNKDARLISVDILTNVLLKNKKLNEEFNSKIKRLSSRDIAFVKSLVYGVLRIKDSIDTAIKKYYRKNYKSLNERYKNILRIGE